MSMKIERLVVTLFKWRFDSANPRLKLTQRMANAQTRIAGMYQGMHPEVSGFGA